MVSVADNILSDYGFTWELNPYRILDEKGNVVQSGPHFDVRPEVLKAQRVRIDKKYGVFKKKGI